MIENPRDRIFSRKEKQFQENYLPLKQILVVNYEYSFVNDFKNMLKKNQL